MTITNLSLLRPLLTLFVTLCVFCSAQASDAPATPQEDLNSLTLEQSTLRLNEAKEALSAIPEEAEPSEQDQQLKVTLQRHISLLEEYSAQLKSLDMFKPSDDLQLQIDKATQRLQELSETSATAVTLPAQAIDQPALEKQLDEWRSEKSGLVEQQAKQQQLETELPDFLNAANTRLQEAEQRESMLNKSKSAEQSQTAVDLVDKQIENTQLDQLVAKQAKALLEARQQWFRAQEPLVQAKLEVSELEITRLEGMLELYLHAKEQELAEQAKQAEAELAEKERTAQEAESPVERFLATWEAAIARTQKNISDYQAFAATLSKEITEQEKWTELDNDEFITIKNLLAGQSSGAASERIKRSLIQARQQSTLLQKSLADDKFSRLEGLRERNFIISDTLFSLKDDFDSQKETVLAQLDTQEANTFRNASQNLLPDYRSSLRDEKSALTEVLSLGQKLQLATEQRLVKLTEFQRIVRNSSFWIKDAEPLGWKTLTALPADLLNNLSWLQQLLTGAAVPRLMQAVKQADTLFYLVTLLVLLPVGLYLLRNRLRRFSTDINDKVTAQGKSLLLGGLVLLSGLLSAAILPIYMFVLARMVQSTGQDSELAAICSQLFDHLAAVLLLWFASRSFLAGRSISEVQFDLPRESANALHAALRWFIIAYLFYLPALLLEQPPFNNNGLPRIFSVLFFTISTFSVFRLARPGNAYVKHQLEQLAITKLTASWLICSRLLTAIAAVSVLLDAVGYHYAAVSILSSLAGTLVILLLLPPIYRQLYGRVIRLVRRRIAIASTSDDATVGDGTPKAITPGLIKFFSLLIGLLLLLRVWGVDAQALYALDDIQLYKVIITGAEPEFVTLGSIVRSVLFCALMIWAIKVLPDFMQIWVNPHWGADVGVKYAVTTISRYGLVLVGVFYVIAELHMDLAKLGWLMAAVGVGLGFGLQEIVSNFVSGLILLAERPVKPGDTVTIGNLTGTVSRINIRATTIVNFDRQEVMVPNRNLITNEVINWTRSDTINRVVVAIGIAYGSDVDAVSNLLLQIAREQQKILPQPEPRVVFIQHGESSLDLELRVFVASPDDILAVRDKLNREISRRFAEHDIEIPFPQRDLHIRSGSLVTAPVQATADQG